MKMKRLITSVLLLLAFLFPVAPAYAYDFEVDGIYYNFRSDAGIVEVTESPSTNKYSGAVTIPETVTYNGSTYTVKVIDDWAFSGCNGLTSVTIGNSVSIIGIQAFAHCDNLTSVNIGSAVTYIGDNVFSYTRNLSHLVVASENPRYDSRDDCNAVILTANNILWAGCQSTVIPNSVTGIRMGAFAGCVGLTSVVIPGSVTGIGTGAFSGCANLESIIVDNGNAAYDSRDNCNAIIETASNRLFAGCQNTVIPSTVTSIGDYAFAGMSGLTSIAIPESVTAIGENAFQDCSGLTSVAIPSSVTSIGKYAFMRCSGLTSVTIPSSVTSIMEGMFLMCSGLTSVTIPCSVTSIGNYAFVECSGLTCLTIPGSVSAIGTWAFWKCTGLTDVYSHIADLSSVTCGSATFYLSDKNYSGRTLHVPQGAADAYQADEHWYPYFEQIVDDVMPEEYLRGDVNLDGEIDLSDINAVVDIILGRDIYAARADVNSDGEITIADINVIIDIIVSAHEEPEHEWVDLGLPSGTLWATCNVGANAPEEFGHQFAWGETAPKETYSWDTYKWCENGLLTRYCNDSSFGPVDNKVELDPEDDAAYVNWGPSWRMPTVAQLEELYDNCTQQWTTMNGVKGILVTGPNGNTMFLPAAGFNWGDNNTGEGTSGDIWSRELYTNICDFAYRLMFHYEGWRAPSTGTRSFGSTVRAVRIPF